MHLGHADVPGLDPRPPEGSLGRAHRRRERRELTHVFRGRRPAGLLAGEDLDGNVGVVAGPLGRRDNGGGRPVGDRTALEQAERSGDHPRTEHLLPAHLGLELGVRVARAMAAMLHGDVGERIGARSVLARHGRTS